ncbi:MAG: prenyltransferase/squalene oxidase repeat-containing protein, partial [bacterium]
TRSGGAVGVMLSWQLVVFALLGLVIAGGIAWYERSRPSSRMVALVAALAALAVAGRLVFAPIPSVVATTDVALITGFALGGAPGFAVGALAAPVSNLWLGQGPWTAWQMAGWGLCGLAGAGLAALSGRRLGRLGLAAACAAAGLAYGALLDLSVMVSYGGEQSLDRYLALSARGIPFNLAHALGNFAIAFAAGPALVRMISRFRDRLEFTWRPAPALPVVLIAIVSAATITTAPRAEAGAPTDARIYLERQQNSDGGFGATPTASSNVDMTAWAMLGMEASRRNPLDLRRGGRSPLDFLRSHASEIRSVADLEKTVLALAGAGAGPRSFDGRDLVAKLRSYRAGNGSFSGYVDLTAFGVLALRAGGTPAGALERSGRWLRNAQNGDGGWGLKPGQPSTPDSTGSALQALAVAGRGPALSKGVGFLRRAQSSDGGWALYGGGTNSQSTAWGIQGLIAAGTDPASVTSGGRSPLSYIAARQAGDGHYRYSASSDQTPIWVTSQALMAVEREPFPVAAVPRSWKPGGLPDAPAGPGADAGPGAGAGSATKESQGAGGARRHKGRAGEGEPDAPGKQAGGAPAADEAALASAAAPGGTASGDDGGGPGPMAYLGGGLGLLALALGGSFLLYRKQLS